MIAYNSHNLDNRAIQAQAAEALSRTIITAAGYERIREAYPSKLYTPNFFVRIGLFLLTVLAVACFAGLLLLIGLTGIKEKGIGAELILCGLFAYGTLEFFIQGRGTYRAGVDDALLWIACGLVLVGINLCFDHISPTVQSFWVLLLATWGAIRFTDRLMALTAYGALLSMLIFLTGDLGQAATAILPFLIMAVSVALYLLFTRFSALQRLRHYRSCLMLLRMATLLSFYLAGNYYVVRELRAYLTYQSGPVGFGWLWWALTVVLPFIYIIHGVRKKDVIFLWTGLGLIAAAVFTVRIYYHVLPAELAMVIGGSLLLCSAYFLIRYLREPQHGFTSSEPDAPHILENLPVEAIIQAEGLRAPAQPEEDFRFGGGSGGGGGAGRSF